MATEYRTKTRLAGFPIVDADVHLHESPEALAPYCELPWRKSLEALRGVPERYEEPRPPASRAPSARGVGVHSDGRTPGGESGTGVGTGAERSSDDSRRRARAGPFYRLRW